MPLSFSLLRALDAVSGLYSWAPLLAGSSLELTEEEEARSIFPRNLPCQFAGTATLLYSHVDPQMVKGKSVSSSY